MSWVARIPEIKDTNNLTNSGFGLVLLASALGSITGAQLSGRLIHSFGSRNVMRFAAVTMSVGICGIALSSHPVFLAQIYVSVFKLLHLKTLCLKEACPHFMGCGV
jgi:MFS family permease